MAYVAILFILIIILAMGLTFLLRAGTETAATLGFDEGIKAAYLAEAAANHAAWRLLNDPGIPTYAEAESADEYQMYSWSGGRYGYNFRPQTNTTFATIRTVGTMGETITRQAYVVNFKSLPFAGILCAYAPTGTFTPLYRNFDDPDWANAVSATNVGSEPRWVQLSGSSVRSEVIMGTLDNADDLNVTVFDGSNWTTAYQFTGSSDEDYRSFDVAHESLSGDGMVVGRYTTGRSPYYSTWNGTSWSAPAIISNPYGSGDIRMVCMASNPGSNEILMGALTSDRDLVFSIWNGSAWSSFTHATGSMSSNAYRPFGVAYEQQSGHGLVLYGTSSNQLLYGTWNGSSTGGGTVTGTGNRPRIVRLASDPSSDYIIAAVVDADNDLRVEVWNGSSWVFNSEIVTNMLNATMLVVEVAWEASGTEALVFYSQSWPDNLRYRRYTKATNSLSGAVSGPNFGADIESIQALTIPDEDRIIVLAGNALDDLKYTLWNGAGFDYSTPVVLNTSLFDTPKESFELVNAMLF